MYLPGCIILLLNAEMRPYLLPMVLSVLINKLLTSKATGVLVEMSLYFLCIHLALKKQQTWARSISGEWFLKLLFLCAQILYPVLNGKVYHKG